MCIRPVTGQPLAAQEPAWSDFLGGVCSWAGLEVEVEVAECLTVGLSDWRTAKLVRLCLSVATAGYHSGTP